MTEAIGGLEELQRALASLELEAKEGKKVIRASWRKAANTLRDAARSKAPVLSGQLKRKIVTLSPRGEPGTFKHQVRSTVRAKPAKKNPQGFPYGGVVERGHGFPGTRARQNKKAKQEEFGTSQVAARPYMRPAWNENKQAVLDRFKEELASRIAQIARE